MARVIHKRGIRSWKWNWPKVDRIDTCGGIACMPSSSFLNWNVYDADPDFLEFTFANPETRRVPDICMHWPQFLRYNPEHNFERVEQWKNYFLRITSPFGMMLAHDVGEAASQTFYSKYAAVDTVDGGYRIACENVDNRDTELIKKEFYVSLKGGEEIKKCVGGSFSLYDARADHNVYKITREDNASVITLGV